MLEPPTQTSFTASAYLTIKSIVLFFPQEDLNFSVVQFISSINKSFSMDVDAMD